MHNFDFDLNKNTVRNRIEKVLSFCERYLDFDGDNAFPREIPQQTRDNYFGKDKSDKLSNWLRKNLLIVARHYDTRSSKANSYVCNQNTFNFLKEQLELPFQQKRVRVKKVQKHNMVTINSPTDHIINLTEQVSINFKKSKTNQYIPFATPEQLESASLLLKKHPFLTLPQAIQLITGTFFYNKSKVAKRLTNELQNIPNHNNTKSTVFKAAGFQFDYDIETAAPAIIYQSHILFGGPAFLVSAIKDYIDNKNHLRSKLFNLLAEPTDTPSIIEKKKNNTKRIINSLFNGARVGHNSRWATYKLVAEAIQHDRNRQAKLTSFIDFLQTDKEIALLRSHIKHAWNTIRNKLYLLKYGINSEPFPCVFNHFIKLITFTGLTKNLRSSKHKWAYYHLAETMIMNHIISITGNKNVFIEHDGLKTKFELDIDSIKLSIKQNLSFDLNFKITTL